MALSVCRLFFARFMHWCRTISSLCFTCKNHITNAWEENDGKLILKPRKSIDYACYAIPSSKAPFSPLLSFPNKPLFLLNLPQKTTSRQIKFSFCLRRFTKLSNWMCFKSLQFDGVCFCYFMELKKQREREKKKNWKNWVHIMRCWPRRNVSIDWLISVSLYLPPLVGAGAVFNSISLSYAIFTINFT